MITGVIINFGDGSLVLKYYTFANSKAQYAVIPHHLLNEAKKYYKNKKLVYCNLITENSITFIESFIESFITDSKNLVEFEKFYDENE